MGVYKKIHKCSKILDNLYNGWRWHIYYWDFLGQQIRTNFGHWNTGCVRNIKKNIIGTPGRIQFFIEYHEHSKITVEIIKKAYGRDSKTLGRCLFASGNVIIDDPEESRIADIAIARTHLCEGYPSIWSLKNEAENESRKMIDKIRTAWSEVKSIISTELEHEIDNTGTKLIRKPSLFNEREYPVDCYYREVIPEIVNEITMRSAGKIPKLLETRYEFEPRSSPSDNTPVTMCVLSFGKNGLKLCRVKEPVRKDIMSRIDELLASSQLNERISRVRDLIDNFVMNKKRSEFFSKIDELWNDIYIESQSLSQNARCSLCPFKEY